LTTSNLTRTPPDHTRLGHRRSPPEGPERQQRAGRHETGDHATPLQVAELLRAAEGSRYASLFALLVHTGLRRGEALALQWSDVDLAKRLLRVRGTLARSDGELLVTEPKTAKSKRFAPVSAPAERLLRDLHAGVHAVQ
jgi:integrase